jgi:acyl transferase domain-containing protein/NAD(P)-dependent dehydrogenase (short-subunit alcohol dehydrogenase family)/acyl carrier protein
MGQQLFQREPVFAEFVRKADAEFQSISGWSILDEMQRSKETSRINQTIYAQPAIFILQAGLLHLLRSWGVEPAAALGHSLGENASAYAAGILTLEQAVFVGYHRSQILARAAGLGGGMLAVGLSEEEALSVIAPYGDRVTIAAVNAPKNVTLAGESEALAEVASRLQVKSVFNRALKVEVAYHSAFMNPLQQPLIEILAELEPGAPQIPIYSTVTGAPVTGRAYDGHYWAKNIRQSVQFLRALESAIADGHKLFLEVGAHPALAPSIREYAARTQSDAEVVSTLVRETDECKTLYKSLASLYAAGCDLNWDSINSQTGQMLPLPAYAWQRETYWEETPAALEQRVGGAPTGLQGSRLDLHEPVWERQISNKFLPFVDDHIVQKLVLLPGAAFVDAALSLGQEIGNASAPAAIEDLRFIQPLVLDRNDDVTLRSVLDPQSRRVVFYGRSRRQKGWTRHAEARLAAKLIARPGQVDLFGTAERMDSIDVAEFYSGLMKLGLQYGESFRRITKLRARGREVLAQLASIENPERYDIEHKLHPAVLDSAFQSLMATVGEGEDAYVPASIEQVVVFDEMPAEAWCYGRLTEQDDDAVAGEITLMDGDGRVVAMISGLRCARIAKAGARQAAVLERRLFRPTWHETTFEPAKRRTGRWMVIAEDNFKEDSFAALLAEALMREGCEDVILAGAGREMDLPGELAGLAYVTCDREDDPDAAIARTCRLAEMFKKLPANGSLLRAYLITERAQTVEAGDPATGFLQASAAGFFRVAHNEFPGWMCTVVDHDGDLITAGDVAAELMSDDEADEVAWRAGVRYTQRMEACTLLELEQDHIKNRAMRPVAGDTYTLARTESGLAATGDARRDVLYWKHSPRPELAGDEVEIAVAYWRAGQADARTAWREFSGRVLRTGPAVTAWKAGESIAAAALCEMSSHVVVREQEMRAIRLQAAPSMEAAPLAITGASVDVALRQMARAGKGETVLMVGGAEDDAAQMFSTAAKDLGMRVIRAGEGTSIALREGALEQRIRTANDGNPVQIVVFCSPVDRALYNRIPLEFGGRVVLYGEAEKSVDVARFISSETMYALYRVDPVALAAANAPAYREALEHLAAVARHSASGPQRVCSADELPREAAELGGDLRGLTVDMNVLREVAPANTGSVEIDANAAYMITGGFGGFGLAVADYLIARGARKLVLAGRSGATTEDAKRRVAGWRRLGADIREALLDITNADAVDALIAQLNGECDIKGIMHAAGVVDDGRIADMKREQVERVMRPKVQGAWNLHNCSVRYKLKLDYFVLFSSVASLVGNGGQANYVAANAVLDALAAYRRSLGLAASSVNWGALAEVGMATNDELRRQFQLMGITPFSADEAIFGLNAVLRFGPTQIGIMDVDWVQWGKYEPAGGKSLRFAHLTGKRGGGASDSLASSLRQFAAKERFEVAELMLAEQVAQTLRIPAERIDTRRALTEMGIDSLMAVELQIAINMTFGVEFSALELTRGFSINQLTTPLLERMGLAGEPAKATASTPASDVNLDALFVPPAVSSMPLGQLAG